MVKIIKNLILRSFPELRGSYHLARDGRIVSVSDAPKEEGGTASDDFRPYYAVDVQLLKADGTDDTDHPVMESLPLPATMAGDEAGQYGFPREGAKVVIGFRYGSPGHPYIHSVLPQGLAIPPCQPGEQIWQHSFGCHQKADRKGNWERISSGSITDDSLERTVRADVNLEEYGASEKTVDGDESETIDGSKTIETLGALVLKAATTLQLTAAGDISQTALQHRIEAIGRTLSQIIGEGAQIDVVLGKYLLSGPNSELGFDETGLIVLENNITSLKDWLNDVVSEIQNIVVTYGTGPNVAQLEQLKTELGFLLK